MSSKRLPLFPLNAFGVLACLPCLAHAQLQVPWFQLVDSDHGAPATARYPERSGGVVTDEAGNVYLAVPDLPSHGGAVVAFSASGAQLWRTVVNVMPPQPQVNDLGTTLTSLTRDPVSQDLIVGGLFRGFGRGAVTARLDAAGNVRWSRFDADLGGGNFSPFATGPMIFDGAGNSIAVVGGATDAVEGKVAAEARDANGALLWSRSYATLQSPARVTNVTSVTRGPGGEILVTGHVGSSLKLLTADAFLLVLDANGNELWRSIYGPGAGSVFFEAFHGAVADAAGNVYACGEISRGTTSFFTPDRAAVLVAYDASGVERWSRIQDDAGVLDESFRAVALERNEIVVAGSAAPSASVEARLARFDALGNLVWARDFGDAGPRAELFRSLAIDTFGDIVAGGASTLALGTATDGDALVVRCDRGGNAKWEHHGLFTTASYDEASHVAIGAESDVFAAGFTANGLLIGGVSGEDALVVKLRSPSAVACAGDGSTLPCPCGNNAAAGEARGCLNSFGIGATLRDVGTASLFADTLVLEAAGMPNSTAFFFGMRPYSGASVPAPFGDGIGCVMGSNSLFRVGSKAIAGGVARYPELGNTPLSATAGAASAYQSVLYQVMYRNSAASFCTPGTVNTTAGLLVHWTP